MTSIINRIFLRKQPCVNRFFVWIGIALLSGLCGGCCSAHLYPMRAVMVAAENVDATDGIDASEAVVLAQNLIYSKALHDRLYNLDPIRVQLKQIPDADGDMVYSVDALNYQATYQGKQYWEVQFRDKEGSLFWGWYPLYPFFVEINAADGSVVDWGLRKNYPEK